MTSERPTALLHGTSSWHEKSWVGGFYPEGTRQKDWLSYYATQFGTVEVDSTYYGVPRATTVDGWLNRTPDGFVMCAKFPRGIVHAGEGPRPEQDALLVPDRVGGELDEFLTVMRRLGDRCGPLVLQFPHFSRTVFEDLDAFLPRLDSFVASLPDDFRYAVEIRNRAWMTSPLLDVLRRHRVALVWTEIVNMPHPAELAASLDLVTTDFIYARLIGDRRALDAKTDRFDRVVMDRGANLRRWAQVLKDTLPRIPTAYVYANNHYAGHAPETIRTLIRMLREEEDA